jgi:hypothetical protein
LPESLFANLGAKMHTIPEMITKAEFNRQTMAYRQIQEVLPFLDVKENRRLFESCVSKGFIEVPIEYDTSSPRRGKARRYSVRHCLEFAVVWSLNNVGYKPSAIINIIRLVVERAEELINTVSTIDDIAYMEWPVVIFYETKGRQIGPLRAVSAPADQIAAWVAKPSSEKARKVAHGIRELTGTPGETLIGYFIFEADYIIRRTLEGYQELTNASQ